MTLSRSTLIILALGSSWVTSGGTGHNAGPYHEPNYGYGYGVADHTTGDIKSAQETRHGGWTKGSYSILQPDGVMRVVTYVADSKNGFQATVHNSQQAWTAPQPQHVAPPKPPSHNAEIPIHHPGPVLVSHPPPPPPPPVEPVVHHTEGWTPTEPTVEKVKLGWTSPSLPHTSNGWRFHSEHGAHKSLTKSKLPHMDVVIFKKDRR